jgi:hypothetical protein
MKPILISATLFILAAHPLPAQDKTNAPAAPAPGTNGPVLAEAAAPAPGRSLFGHAPATNEPGPAKEPGRTTDGSTATNVPDAKSASPRGTTNSLDYSSFKVIVDRNIFDATRTEMGSRIVDIQKPAPVTRIDHFKLIGTILYEKGRFAFFSGSGSDFRGTIQTGQKIADYTVVEIGYSGVKLAGTNGDPFELTVGKQMKRVDDGPWSLASAGDTFSSSSDSQASSDKGSDTPSGSSDAENEVLKRLMQKRAKELNK